MRNLQLNLTIFFCLPIHQHQELHQGTNQQELIQIAEYYFDGQGKALRPMVTMLMGKAINYHMHRENRFVVVFGDRSWLSRLNPRRHIFCLPLF